jgi:hypothetical protein
VYIPFSKIEHSDQKAEYRSLKLKNPLSKTGKPLGKTETAPKIEKSAQ